MNLRGSVGSNPTFSGSEAVSVNRERCESGRIGLPAKELYSRGYRGFESHPLRYVPIAQLDRALDCGSKGRRFESSWARNQRGEMRERLNRADSKSVELLASSVGSNPTLSVLAGQLRAAF